MRSNAFTPASECAAASAATSPELESPDETQGDDPVVPCQGCPSIFLSGLVVCGVARSSHGAAQANDQDTSSPVPPVKLKHGIAIGHPIVLWARGASACAE